MFEPQQCILGVIAHLKNSYTEITSVIKRFIIRSCFYFKVERIHNIVEKVRENVSNIQLSTVTFPTYVPIAA